MMGHVLIGAEQQSFADIARSMAGHRIELLIDEPKNGSMDLLKNWNIEEQSLNGCLEDYCNEPSTLNDGSAILADYRIFCHFREQDSKP